MSISITDKDFIIYSDAFDTAKTSGTSIIQADAARDVLLRSNLPMVTLYKIWNLVDYEKKGHLNKIQFVLALQLAKIAITEGSLPDTLSQETFSRLNAYNPTLHNNVFSIGSTNSPFLGHLTNISPSNASDTTQLPNNSQAVSQTDIDDLTKNFEKRFPDFNNIQTSIKESSPQLHSINNFSSPVNSLPTNSTNWSISASEMKSYQSKYSILDPNNIGYLSGEVVKNTLLNSGVPVSELSQIWRLVDTVKNGNLTKNDFINALHIVSKRLVGIPIPEKLPSTLSKQNIFNFDDSISDLKKNLLNSEKPKSPSNLNNSDQYLLSSSIAFNKYNQDGDIPKSSLRHNSMSPKLSQNSQSQQINTPFLTGSTNIAKNDKKLNLNNDTIESQIIQLASQTLDLNSFSTKSFTVNDTSNGSAARIAERMKTLAGIDYDINLGLSPIEQSSEFQPSLNELQTHKENLKQININIAEIEKKLTDMGLDGILKIKDLSMFLDNSSYQKYENSIGVSNKNTLDLIAQLSSIKGENVDPTVLIPQLSSFLPNSFSDIQSNTPTHSNSPFNDVTPSATRGSEPPLNSGRSSKLFGDTKSPEDRSQRLKRLAEEKFKERQRALGLILDDDNDSLTFNNINSKTDRPEEPKKTESPFANVIKSDENSHIQDTKSIHQLPESVFESDSILNNTHSAYTNPFKKVLNNNETPLETFTHDKSLKREENGNIVELNDSSSLQDAKTQQFQSTAATLFSKLFGSPSENSSQFKGSLEIAVDESDTSSESSFDFDESTPENKKADL
ncbi:hypothetical protein BB561_000449 [Smittium simulii]|uniref:EH domain-containing protein n=1 Tax=Smittium simulii TaxID=133385 RepID=A0A2T9YZ58_9FUNG|nr:hypothetical protein BB561_000449 [Smittium simulii]